MILANRGLARALMQSTCVSAPSLLVALLLPFGPAAIEATLLSPHYYSLQETCACQHRRKLGYLQGHITSCRSHEGMFQRQAWSRTVFASVAPCELFVGGFLAVVPKAHSTLNCPCRQALAQSRSSSASQIQLFRALPGWRRRCLPCRPFTCCLRGSSWS